MAAKRPPLAAIGMFAPPAVAPLAGPSAAPAVALAELPAKPGSTGSRAGKKASPFWIPTAAKRQLKGMVFDMELTEQALLTEALNDLFKKYGKPPIA